MSATADDTTSELLNIMTNLWNSTCRDSDPKHEARVYLESHDGTTAHGVVGGQSKSDIKAKVKQAIPQNVRAVKIEKADENPIDHPLRGE